MHVLMLSSWYQTEDKPWRGTFFRDHALSLIRSGILIENDSVSALAGAMYEIRTRQFDPRASASRFRYESVASRMVGIYAALAPRARVA